MHASSFAVIFIAMVGYSIDVSFGILLTAVSEFCRWGMS